jgi:DNA sulfur modification protein DndD
MKFERIVLENFRQYYGSEKLTFSKDPQKPVTVIHGANGAGKTSFFLALNWCLYDRSSENTTVIDNVGELISKEAIVRASPGDLVKTKVEVKFTHNGDHYYVSRSLEGIRLANSYQLGNIRPDFIMQRTSYDGEAVTIKNPIGVMNSILPVNVREYFLFDGEKIDNFAKPEAAAQVKAAIYLVLKLELLERGRRHLDVAAKEYRELIKQEAKGELSSLMDQEINLVEELRINDNAKSQKEDERKRAKEKISEIDIELVNTQQARELQKTRERVTQELQESQKEREKVINTLAGLASEGYLVKLKPAIDKALAVLNDKRSRGEIPSSVRQQFVQDLIDQMQCICGRSFTEDSPEHQKLLSLLHRSISSKLEDDILNTALLLHGFEERARVLQDDIEAGKQKHAQLRSHIRGLEDQQDDISRQLKDSPLEEISGLETKRKNFEGDIESSNLAIGSLEERIRIGNQHLQELRNKISNVKKIADRERFLIKKLELAEKASDALKDTHQKFADDMRQKIEAKTKEIFQKLAWKEGHFRDVKLGPDFNLEVLDRYGLPARPELSAGERQVLSLSFIAAMSRISEEEAPLVMDTPFGRLSSQHRESITLHLPELASQLVLFVTDEELRDQAKANLAGKIGAEYKLEFDDLTSCTKIEEYKGA